MGKPTRSGGGRKSLEPKDNSLDSGMSKLEKKGVDLPEGSQTKKRTRSQKDSGNSHSTKGVESTQDLNKDVDDNQLNKELQEKERESDQDNGRDNENDRRQFRSRTRSRSVTPEGGNHLVKPVEETGESDSDVETKGGKRKKPKTRRRQRSRSRSRSINNTPKKKKMRFKDSAEARSSASEDEVSMAGSSEEEFKDYEQSEQSTPETSGVSSDSDSSTDEDDKAYKRRRWSRSWSKRSSKLSRRSRERSSSRSRSKGQGASRSSRRKHKKRRYDVDAIVKQALDKQRKQMEEYFERKLEKRADRDADPGNPKSNPLLKSPSDTTIYKPAVRKANNLVPMVNAQVEIRQKQDSIDEFIQGVRNKVVIAESNPDEPDERDQDVNQNVPRNAAEEAIVQAEKYKAKIDNPKGELVNLVDTLGYEGVLDDDKFIQVSCHVEDSVVEQISKGGFVEIVKIKPKSSSKIHQEEGAMELKYKDGKQYWVPAEQSNAKITNVRQWEECFRVYAEIYSRANPTRASEIWQYVDVINKAASTFTWENVALYDYHFRKMMAKNPLRSWAKTFNQMWNVDLRDHLPRGHTGSQGGSRDSTNGKPICWKFNKNNCPYGKKCRFDHRCTFCGGTSHGSCNCRRKPGNQQTDKVDKKHKKQKNTPAENQETPAP